MKEDTADGAIVLEEHRRWKFAYDFLRNEEVVVVDRPDGSSQTYRGEHAHKFWLRSQGLTRDAADMVWENRQQARAAEAPTTVDEEQAHTDEEFEAALMLAHEKFHEFADVLQELMYAAAGSGHMGQPVTMSEEFPRMLAQIGAGVAAGMRNDHGEVVPLPFAVVTLALNMLDGLFHDEDGDH